MNGMCDMVLWVVKCYLPDIGEFVRVLRVGHDLGQSRLQVQAVVGGRLRHAHAARPINLSYEQKARRDLASWSKCRLSCLRVAGSIPGHDNL